MVTVAVVYHSGYGHTEKQAQHVAKGVELVKGVNVSLLKAEDLIEAPEQLNSAAGIIFGSPTYMGTATAKMKEFMEASSKIWFQQGWRNKVAGGFTNSHSLSGDKLNTLVHMQIFAMQHGMIWIGTGCLNQSPDGQAGAPNAINRLGGFVGAMAQSENAPPSETPPQGDLDTAERLGQRVASLAMALRDTHKQILA